MITTPEQAMTDWQCPIARIRPNTTAPECMGDKCALWRFVPLDVKTSGFGAAVAKRMAEGHQHKAATAWVTENREQLGLPTKPTHGYCGLGGEVKV